MPLKHTLSFHKESVMLVGCRMLERIHQALRTHYQNRGHPPAELYNVCSSWSASHWERIIGHLDHLLQQSSNGSTKRGTKWRETISSYL